jgi:ABC-2 type transport system permease protein
VSAQALACGLAGVVIGLTAFVLATAVAIPWLSAKDAPLPPVSDLLELVAGVVAYAGLAAVLGAGFGALLRNQVAAVVIVLVELFVVDPTLVALDEDVGAFTLTGLGSAISGVDDATLLAPVTAALVWALYSLLFVALAAIRTANRDI